VLPVVAEGRGPGAGRLGLLLYWSLQSVSVRHAMQQSLEIIAHRRRRGVEHVGSRYDCLSRKASLTAKPSAKDAPRVSRRDYRTRMRQAKGPAVIGPFALSGVARSSPPRYAARQFTRRITCRIRSWVRAWLRRLIGGITRRIVQRLSGWIVRGRLRRIVQGVRIFGHKNIPSLLP
jgi:hypothetical protein